MKRVLFNLYGYDTSNDRYAIALRNTMRAYLKENYPDIYFDKEIPIEGPYNYGCYIFGQKHVYPGILDIEVNQGTVTISVSKIKTYYSDAIRIQNSLRPILHALIKEGVLTKIKEKKCEWLT